MIIGIYGYQDSGKTLLVEQLVRTLSKKGYRVSSVKHSPHKKSADCAGKDTWRHWKAGSDPVVFSSETETTVFKHSGADADSIVAMVSRDYSPDVIILEGFKDGSFPKVSVGDIAPRENTVLRNPGLAKLVAHIEREVAVERKFKELPGLDCHKCGLDCARLARAIVGGKRKLEDCVELPTIGTSITVGGKRIAAGKFVSEIVNDTVRGMLGSLKGYEPGEVVEIRLEAKSGRPKKGSRRK